MKEAAVVETNPKSEGVSLGTYASHAMELLLTLYGMYARTSHPQSLGSQCFGFFSAGLICFGCLSCWPQAIANDWRSYEYASNKLKRNKDLGAPKIDATITIAFPTPVRIGMQICAVFVLLRLLRCHNWQDAL